MEYEILEYLKACADVIKNPTVTYIQFVEFLYKQAESRKSTHLQVLVNNHKEKLIPLLESLVNKQECILIKDSAGLKAVFIFQAAVELILKKYEQLEFGVSTVFPSLENLDFKLPQDSITVVNIKEDFIKLISSTDTSQTPIIKIVFPHSIDNILITRSIVKTKLVKYAVLIIKNFFQGQMNIEFVYNKFVSIFKGSEIALGDMLKVLISRPNAALQSLLEPNYFSFKFWSHLANLVLENLKEKTGMLAKEHSYCQSAYIIGYYIVYQKGIIQKEKQKELDLKKIDTRLKKDPYAYTLQDIYAFVDKNGIPFIKKYSKKLIDNYLTKRIDFSEDLDTLPVIVSVRLKNNTEYFILKDSIIPLFINKVEEASERIKDDLMDEWKYNCMNFIKNKAMNFDFAFLIEIETRVKDDFPMLYALLTNNLPLLARNDTDVPDSIKILLNRFLGDKNKLYELDMLFDLDRIKLLQEVKSRLPLYYTLPIISLFVRLIKWILGRKGTRRIKEEKNSSGENEGYTLDLQNKTQNIQQENGNTGNVRVARKKMSAEEYQKALVSLKEELLGSQKSIETSLVILAEKWNPLIDPVTKADLQEDVNSLIRDFLRSLRKGFRVKPPDTTRIRNLAKELSYNNALKKIKHKEYLIRYIELYMVKNLLEHRMD